MFMIFAGSRILFTNNLKSINGESVLLSTIMKNVSEITAAAPKITTMTILCAAALVVVCMNCNATKNDITVTDSVIAPIKSILGIFFLLTLVLGLLLFSAIVVVVLPLLLFSESSISFLT